MHFYTDFIGKIYPLVELRYLQS